MRLESVLAYMRLRWLRMTGAVTAIHEKAFVHFSAQISQCSPGQIKIGPRALIGRSAWLNVPVCTGGGEAVLSIGQGTAIGRHSVISARNGIQVEDDCVTGPQVLIMDHAHQYEDPTVPIICQGVTEGGRIIIERGCWIGFGAAIICNRGLLRIGQNAVIGANSVVTKSVEARTVVVGAPARLVRRYDAERLAWVHTSAR